jgi:hypothetical protein
LIALLLIYCYFELGFTLSKALNSSGGNVILQGGTAGLYGNGGAIVIQSGTGLLAVCLNISHLVE